MKVLFLILITLYFSYCTFLNKYYLNTNSNKIIEYKNNIPEKDLDIVLILEPYYKEYMFGKIYISSNINFENINDLNNLPCLNISTDEISSYTINFLNNIHAIYFNLKGTFHGILTIFNSNKNITLNINESYYFDYIKLFNKKYISFKIEKLVKTKILNMIPYYNNCSSIKIFENNKLLKCEDNEINNYIFLNPGNEYYIEFYPDIGHSLGINFLDNIISTLDEKKSNIVTLNNFVFYYIMDIRNYLSGNLFSIFVDSKSRFTIKGGFLEKDISRNAIFDISEITDEIFVKEECRFHILNKTNNKFNYLLFRIKIYSDYGEKFMINKIDSIININDTIFKYQLFKNNNYLFFLNKDFLKKYINIKSSVFISYESDNGNDNKMKIITYEEDEYYNKKSLFLNIQNFEGIYFDEGNNGTLIFEFVNQSFSLLLNENYDNILYINSKYIFSLIPDNNDYFIYFNLIAGNINYDSFDNYNKIKEKKNTSIFQHLINDTKYLYFSTPSSSMIEIFYEDRPSYYYLIEKSKIVLLKDNFNYSLIIESNFTDKILIKLLTDSFVNIYHNNKLYNINKYNNKIEININDDNIIICNGNNDLINIFLPINKNLDYQIAKNCEKCSLENVEEFFLIPYFKDYNSMNLHIIIENEEDLDEIQCNYLIDYNEIPYSRNKYNLINSIVLENKKENLIFIKNIIQNDKAVHDKKETFYIYFNLSRNVKKININIEFFDAIYSNYFEPIFVKEGNNKIFLENNKIKYILIDKCENEDNSIKYLVRRNGNIETQEKVFRDEERFINISNNSKNQTFFEINCSKELLLFLSTKEFEFLDGFILNYDINIYYDEEKIIIDFDSITFCKQVEYTILIIEDKNLKDLSNHCLILNLLIKGNYIYKEIIFSNENEGYFRKEIKYEKILKLNKEYIIIIIAKEFNDNYNLYKYYKSKNFNLYFEYSDDNSDKDKDKDKSISKGIIALIIIITIIVIIAIIIAITLILKNKKKKNDFSDIEIGMIKLD